MNRKCLLIICSLMSCLFVSACANTNNAIAEFQTEISSGSLNGTDFDQRHSLTSKNGENVYFYVKNTGIVNVYVSINRNDNSAITLAPGEDGQIFCKVSKFKKSYRFYVIPTPNGGAIGIEYRIYQE